MLETGEVSAEYKTAGWVSGRKGSVPRNPGAGGVPVKFPTVKRRFIQRFRHSARRKPKVSQDVNGALNQLAFFSQFEPRQLEETERRGGQRGHGKKEMEMEEGGLQHSILSIQMSSEGW